MSIPPTETGMPAHRRYKGSSAGSSSFHPPTAASNRKPSPARAATSHRKPSPTMRISSAEAESASHRQSKRSSSASSSKAADASYPTWVMLNRVGARRDSFHGDRTTSAVSYSSGGEQVSVSFELAKPPGTSLLTLDWPQGPRPSEGSTSKPRVIAAHGNVVLLEIIYGAKYPRPAGIDHFVYKASEEPSLTRLPVCYWKGPSNADSPWPRLMNREATGLLSWSKDLFVVAELERTPRQSSEANIYTLCSGSDDWKVFRDVPIRHANGIPDLCWWSTDVALACGHRYMIWVDYFRGMIVADMAHRGNGILDKPVLRYVRLPVDPVQGNPYDSDYGRGCPGASRSLCDTRHGIKFVNITQYGTSFSITLWSLCENRTWREWREDATLDATQLWDLDFEIPNVRPEFPVVDIDNPDTVCFLLNKGHYTADPDAPTWMVKVHMKKKILLDLIHYSNRKSSSCRNTYTTARIMSESFSSISSEMPCYLPV